MTTKWRWIFGCWSKILLCLQIHLRQFHGTRYAAINPAMVNAEELEEQDGDATSNQDFDDNQWDVYNFKQFLSTLRRSNRTLSAEPRDIRPPGRLHFYFRWRSNTLRRALPLFLLELCADSSLLPYVEHVWLFCLSILYKSVMNCNISCIHRYMYFGYDLIILSTLILFYVDTLVEISVLLPIPSS